MPVEGLGGILSEGLEAGAKKLGAKPAEGLLGDVEHFFSFDSQATGKSGQLLKDSVYKGLFPEYDRQLSQGLKQAQRTGITPHPSQIQTEAMDRAKALTYGFHKEHLAVIMKQVEAEHGPAKVSQLTDYMGILMREQAYHPHGTAISASETSSDLAKHPLFKDSPVQFKPSPYRPQSGLERGISKATTMALAPYSAAWHSVQGVLNSTLNAHASSMYKALTDIWGHGFENTKAQMIAQNALGHLMLDEYSQLYRFKTGIISKFADNSIGQFIHKNYLLPGISYVKNMNMVYSAAVGKYEAQWAAKQLLKGGMWQKQAAIKLGDLGIKWQDVLANGGLTPDHERVAMQRVIQQNVFVESAGARARYTATTPLGRTVTIFHNYAVMEGNMITKRMIEILRGNHDPMQVIQMLTALGILFPVAGFGINNILKAFTGREDHPVDKTVDQTKEYLEGKNFSNALMMIGKMGAGGVWYDYANAASRQKLQSAILGAPANAFLEGAGDAYKAVGPGGSHKADQFKRDILRDIPSYGYGARLAHELYPTQAERDAQKPMTARRVRAKQAAQRRKARKGE